MPLYTDQLNRKVMVPDSPKRIVSLVPSQTELLANLGLDDEVVGITKFCIYPNEWFHAKMRIGGTKQYKFDLIASLEPDLIIANKEENDRAGIEYLSERYPVWISDIYTLSDALDMISKIGTITGKAEKAQTIIDEVKTGFQKCQQVFSKQTVAYLIWNEPMMVAGGSTFIHEMLQHIGLTNAFGQRERYPSVSEQEILEAQPNYVFLSSEPYPFKEKHLDYFKRLLPQSKVVLVDGECFSWYGSRLVAAPPYFLSLLEQLR